MVPMYDYWSAHQGARSIAGASTHECRSGDRGFHFALKKPVD